MFARYDPQNLLLRQADREVLERQLDRSRLACCARPIVRCWNVSSIAAGSPARWNGCAVAACGYSTSLAFPPNLDQISDSAC